MDWLKDVVSGGVGGLISGVGSYFSGKSSQNFQKKVLKNKYQWQVQDMKKAGLNPMLSVMNGAPAPSAPPVPNIGEAVVRGASSAIQARLAAAQMKNVEADTELKGSATAVNVMTARKTAIEAGIQEENLPWAGVLAQATAQGADKRIALMQTEINKIAEETVGVKLSNQQLEKIQPLLVEAQKLINQGMSADLVQKKVDSQWYEIMGASDKYGPLLSTLLRIIERATRVK